jgi:toxin ParE1/3/4
VKLRWSRRALRDLIEIGRYIAHDDRAAARRWVERLRERARRIVDHPHAGRMVPYYSQPRLREVLVRTYRIVYRVDVDGIVVITVFEGHRLFPDDALGDE